MVKTLVCPICNLFGSVKSEFTENADKALNNLIHDLTKNNYNITDVKINHFTARHKNNPGYGYSNEVWIQYTIFYENKQEKD